MAGTVLAKRVKKGSEVDRVYRLLKDWILECRFRPGEFLPEVEVAKQCKTSRTPIREACNRLAKERWVSKIQNKGYLVTPVSIQDVIEIYQYRKLLECFTAERTAQLIRPDEIDALRHLLQVEGKPNAKLRGVIEINGTFHRRLGQIAQNQRIFEQLELTLEYVHRLDILSTQRNREWVAHGPILAALEAHDPEAAREAMAKHVDDARDRMLRVFFRGELPGIHQSSSPLDDGPHR